jgi:glucose/arabinose dehydrogenase
MQKHVLSVSLALLASFPAFAQEQQPIVVPLESHVSKPGKVAPDAARLGSLKLPPGFQLSVWAEGLGKPRIMVADGSGTVYVSRRDPGDCWMLRDADGDGLAEIKKKVAEKKDLHGLALRGDQLYLTTIKEVYVADRRTDGTLGPLRPIMENLPDGGQHPNRTIGFGPDGQLYVSVGSTCNACKEPNPESATMLRATPDGKNRKVFASGLRNTIGFAWHPETKQFWGADHGIDWLGDNEQKEELNLLESDQRYGWPYIFADGKVNPADQPEPPLTSEQWRAMSREPKLLFTAHSAPMQMCFYQGKQFPAEYRGDAFLTMHGSWNRQPPSGYEVLRVHFQNGQPVSSTPFLSGFLAQDGEKYVQFGRPVGIATLPDGSLLVGDDDAGRIYRIRFAP